MRQGVGPFRGAREREEGGEGAATAASRQHLGAGPARTSTTAVVVVVVVADATSRTRRGASSARKVAVQRFPPPRRADLAHPSDVVKRVLFFSFSLPPSPYLRLSLSISVFLSGFVCSLYYTYVNVY